MFRNSTASATSTTTAFLVPSSHFCTGLARTTKGRKMTPSPNSTELDATQNQSPLVTRQVTASSATRLTVKAQKVQKALSSGTVSGTMIRLAATARDASTMKNHPIAVPEIRLMTRNARIGIMNTPETVDPTVAVRRRKRFSP